MLSKRPMNLLEFSSSHLACLLAVYRIALSRAS
jgi:hypothetical protein